MEDLYPTVSAPFSLFLLPLLRIAKILVSGKDSLIKTECDTHQMAEALVYTVRQQRNRLSGDKVVNFLGKVVHLESCIVIENEHGYWSVLNSDPDRYYIECFKCGRKDMGLCACWKWELNARAHFSDYISILTHNRHLIYENSKSRLFLYGEYEDPLLRITLPDGTVSIRSDAMLQTPDGIIKNHFDILWIPGSGVIQDSRSSHMDNIHNLFMASVPQVSSIGDSILSWSAMKEAIEHLRDRSLPSDICTLVQKYCVGILPPEEFLFFLDGLRTPSGINMLLRGTSIYPITQYRINDRPLFAYPTAQQFDVLLYLVDSDTLIIQYVDCDHHPETTHCDCRLHVLHIDEWKVEASQPVFLPILQHPLVIPRIPSTHLADIHTQIFEIAILAVNN